LSKKGNMKKIVLTGIMYLASWHSGYSQYVDPLKNDGSHKSPYERQAEESRLKQQNAAYWKKVDEENLRKKTAASDKRDPKLKEGSVKDIDPNMTLGEKKKKYIKSEVFLPGFTAVYANGKWGFVNEQYDLIVPLLYEGFNIQQTTNTYAGDRIAARLDGKWGYIDKTGKVIIPFQYEEAGIFDWGMARVKKNGKYGFIKNDGAVIVPMKYEEASESADRLVVVKFNNKYGCIDHSDKIHIPFLYDYLYVTSSGGKMEVFAELNNKRGVLDETGKVLVPLKYEDVYFESDSLRCVKSNGKWGFIDRKGKLVINYQFDKPAEFIESIHGAFVYRSTGVGKIDKKGTVLIPLQYDALRYVSHDLVSLVKDGKQGLAVKNQVLIPPLYDEISELQGGIYIVKLGWKFGFYPENGGTFAAPQFEKINYHYDQNAHRAYVSDGLISVVLNGETIDVDMSGKKPPPRIHFYAELFEFKEGGKTGLKDKEGNVVVKPIYQYVEAFSEGRAAVAPHIINFNSTVSNWGFINKAGDLIIPIKYFKIGDKFKEGRIAVKEYDIGNWAYIDTTGKEVTRFEFSEVSEFSNGAAVVRRSYQGIGLIDREGNEIIPCVYYSCKGGISEGLLALKDKNNKWGMLDIKGKEILPFKYERLNQCTEGLIGFYSEEKWGFIDKTGQIIIPPQFDTIEPFENGKARAYIGRQLLTIDRTGKRL